MNQLPEEFNVIMMRSAFNYHLQKNEYDRCLLVLNLLGNINYGNSIRNTDNRYNSLCIYFEGKVNLIKKEDHYVRISDTIKVPILIANPLLDAVCQNNINNVKFLVERCNADVNQLVYDDTDMSILSYALNYIQNNSVPTLMYLIDHGATLYNKCKNTNEINREFKFNNDMKKDRNYCYSVFGYEKLLDFLLKDYIQNNL